jgi:hypothetical protein
MSNVERIRALEKRTWILLGIDVLIIIALACIVSRLS